LLKQALLHAGLTAVALVMIMFVANAWGLDRIRQKSDWAAIPFVFSTGIFGQSMGRGTDHYWWWTIGSVAVAALGTFSIRRILR